MTKAGELFKALADQAEIARELLNKVDPDPDTHAYLAGALALLGQIGFIAEGAAHTLGVEHAEGRLDLLIFQWFDQFPSYTAIGQPVAPVTGPEPQ